MNIKNSIVASAILFSALTYAQKNELKTLKKLYAKSELTGKDLSSFLETSNVLSNMSNLTGEDLAYAQFYKAVQPLVQGLDALKLNPANTAVFNTNLSAANLKNSFATLQTLKGTATPELAGQISKVMSAISTQLPNGGYAAMKANKLDDATAYFAMAYESNPKEAEYLFNAASLAHQNAKYEDAINYYKELVKINYTGENTYYLAVNKASGKEEYLQDKATRDRLVKMGTHEQPRDQKIESKKGDIYRNLVALLINQDRLEEAKTLMQDARALNPNDTDLIIAEANLYFQSGDKAKYESLIKEAVGKRPNDPVLFYNLGVVAAESKDVVNATKYYNKAIELDPKNYNAYNNMGVLLISGDVDIVNKMNKLGSSAADNKKYDELSKQRDKNFTQAIPYFEKAYQINPNDDVKRVLLGAYQHLGMDAKYKALKAK